MPAENVHVAHWHSGEKKIFEFGVNYLFNQPPSLGNY